MAVNMKTIVLASVGTLTAFGAIIGMNVAASDSSTETFGGGVSQQTLPRQLPESHADPFQVISDEDEAARRATSNRKIAESESGGTPAYTAPPVIQLEGTFGDSSDPMAGALVKKVDPRPAPEALEVATIEPVAAPKREYKVPETPQATATPAPSSTSDPLAEAALRGALLNGRHQAVSIQTYSPPQSRSVAPMVLQEFKRSAGQGASAALPTSALPDPAPSPVAPLPDPAPAIDLPQRTDAQPAQPGANSRSGAILRTIDPNTPSSYIEGALIDRSGDAAFASFAKEHDADYRSPYRTAQAAIGIDNNGRVYDTARNAMGFDAGTLILPGDQRFATLMYGFNSDDAAQLPVFAQLHDYGPASSAFLNGARVQGTLRLSDESAIIEFDKLVMQDGRIVPISAMGISVDQLRVGVFKNVNRHTISRYSSLLVSGLLKGVGDVGTRIIDNRYAKPENVIIIGDGATGTTTPSDSFTDADRAAIAMGAVKPIGDEMAAVAADGFSRKPTVTAPAGFGFSIVFLEGVTFDQVQ